MRRVLGVLFCAMLILAACGSGAQQEPTPYPTYTLVAALPTYTQYPTYTPYPSPEPTRTPLPEPTAIPSATETPEPTATERPTVGTRKSPVPLGELFLFEHDGAQCAIAVEETMRGEAAREFRNRGEKYLTYSPQEGKEFYLGRIRVAYLEGSADQSVRFDDGDFSIEADNKMFGHTISIWDKTLSVSMYPGAEDTGWVVFQVPAGANVQHIKFSPFLADYAIWFSVSQ